MLLSFKEDVKKNRKIALVTRLNNKNKNNSILEDTFYQSEQVKN